MQLSWLPKSKKGPGEVRYGAKSDTAQSQIRRKVRYGAKSDTAQSQIRRKVRYGTCQSRSVITACAAKNPAAKDPAAKNPAVWSQVRCRSLSQAGTPPDKPEPRLISDYSETAPGRNEIVTVRGN